jgi:CBS domain-containing protein
MKVGQYCKRGVVTINATASIADAARLMREHHVGFLVVLDESTTRNAPVGVLTDRDIVIQIDARDVDTRSLRVGEVMTRDPIIAKEHDDLSDLLPAMRLAGIRRVPVTDASGALTGIIAVDDVIELITGLLCDISGSIRNEQRIERRMRAP